VQNYKPKTYSVVGLMSGTSLDGLDLALSSFWQINGIWHYEIKNAVTVKYPNEWVRQLSSAHYLIKSGLENLHKEFGKFLSLEVNRFLSKTEKPDLIASHGHTIIHEPEKGITFQLGDGHIIAKETGIPVVWDFRSGDVSLGGQGAPLVPVGDKLLFGEYEFCLNLGGFSNVSYDKNGTRIAFDICPVNFVLNKIASELGFDYDKNGEIAATGHINEALLEKLNGLSFYQKFPPKSLGREWVEQEFYPVLANSNIPLNDKLRTVCEHISLQLSAALEIYPKEKILVTGGGAYNEFLIELFRKKTRHQIVIPGSKLVNFKEAMVFAFLGLLRSLNIINCYASVTGASSDSCAGVISYP
jgi:anhydro-N-acetylmuramic acid kinase